MYNTGFYTCPYIYLYQRTLYFQVTLSYCLPSFLLSLKDSFNCFHKDSLVVMNSLSPFLSERIYSSLLKTDLPDRVFWQFFLSALYLVAFWSVSFLKKNLIAYGCSLYVMSRSCCFQGSLGSLITSQCVSLYPTWSLNFLYLYIHFFPQTWEVLGP